MTYPASSRRWRASAAGTTGSGC
uniref:Znod1 n=1 Tax=Arundo donax TaxID=35708 RepID=A0A0A9EPZ3_ARUDO